MGFEALVLEVVACAGGIRTFVMRGDRALRWYRQIAEQSDSTENLQVDAPSSPSAMPSAEPFVVRHRVSRVFEPNADRACLAVPNCNDVRFEIDVRPTQTEQFPAPRSGVDGKRNGPDGTMARRSVRSGDRERAPRLARLREAEGP